MKKTLLTILLGAFGAMAIAAPALAATSVSFTPVNVSVRQGQSFTLTIGINPQGAKNYTAKTELRYPADLLEVKSFTFASGWTPLSQSGYDLTDNTNGVFIKTAGYPGGVSSAVTFGTVSFLAKKSGNGTIALNSNSFVLDANNQNILADAVVRTTVAISAPSAPAETTQTPQAPGSESTTEVELEQAPIAEEQSIPQSAPAQPMLAQVAAFITLGTGDTFVGVLVAIVLVALIGYAAYNITRRIRRRKQEK